MNSVGRVQWLHRHLESGTKKDLDLGLEPFVEWRDGIRCLTGPGLEAFQYGLTDHLFGRWRTPDRPGVSLAYWCSSLDFAPRADLLQAVVDLSWGQAGVGGDQRLFKLNEMCRHAKINPSGSVVWGATHSIDEDELALLEPKPDAFVQRLLDTIADDSQSLVGSRTESLEPILKFVATVMDEAMPTIGIQRFMTAFNKHAGRGPYQDRVAAVARCVMLTQVVSRTADNVEVVRPRKTPLRSRALAL